MWGVCHVYLLSTCQIQNYGRRRALAAHARLNTDPASLGSCYTSKYKHTSPKCVEENEHVQDLFCMPVVCLPGKHFFCSTHLISARENSEQVLFQLRGQLDRDLVTQPPG
jgi:hypothetical protein